eukprot:superscaffoldBa00006828_g21931
MYFRPSTFRCILLRWVRMLGFSIVYGTVTLKMYSLVVLFFLLHRKSELLFLCWGSSLWTAVRPVPSAFHEPRYMGIAIHNELLLSSMFHLFRFTFPSLHPDWMLLLSFTHTHVTITVTLALLFIPK